ncbi:MAG: hypothetical protein ACR2JM_08875 [Mycobacterium sp.]
MFTHRFVRTTLSAFAVAVALAPSAGADPNPGDQPGVPAVDAAPVHDLSAPANLPVQPPAALPVPPPADLPVAPPVDAPEAGPVVVPAAHVDVSPRALPPGDCPEAGLQIKTILAERAVSAEFPAITNMIGVRPDSKPWHPNGLAVDIMIPNAGSADGIALGDAILAYAMANADRFGVQDVICRGTYYTPANGPSGSGYGHYDHVHITTTGGGYPTGGEEYLAG